MSLQCTLLYCYQVSETLCKMKDSGEHEKEEMHSLSCDCHDCKMKYGNLPLLLEGIESKSMMESESARDTAVPSTSSCQQRPRRTIKCSVCDKLFTHKGDFRKHLRTHSGERPFSCTVCARLFSHSSNLARHMKVHSGEKPFGCEVCNKQFGRKDKLALHQKTIRCRKKQERTAKESSESD